MTNVDIVRYHFKGTYKTIFTTRFYKFDVIGM